MGILLQINSFFWLNEMKMNRWNDNDFFFFLNKSIIDLDLGFQGEERKLKRIGTRSSDATDVIREDCNPLQLGKEEIRVLRRTMKREISVYRKERDRFGLCTFARASHRLHHRLHTLTLKSTFKRI